MLRAVIDTNLLVSSLLSRTGTPDLLQTAWATRLFHCVVSSHLLNEYHIVVARPRLAKSFLLVPEDVESLLTVLFETAEVVELPSHYSFGLRDPKDEMVVATAIAGGADFIVSGDRDLLEFDLSSHSSSVRVVTAADFIALLQSPRD